MSSLRFAFGRNWQAYTQHALTDERVENARASFRDLLTGIPLRDASFLDIGFGQGLTLCLAQEMGAQVLGIDNDHENIAALQRTVRKLGMTCPPEIRIASILDRAFVEECRERGGFDVVHAWGVLHHTGDMKRAIRHAVEVVKPGGFLILAIYNKHWSSPFWWHIKRLYNYAPSSLQKSMIYMFYPVIYGAKALVTGQNPKRKDRGMDFLHNVIDWVGGFPYEYASHVDIQASLSEQGMECVRTIPAPVPTGCNQFVCKKL